MGWVGEKVPRSGLSCYAWGGGVVMGFERRRHRLCVCAVREFAGRTELRECVLVACLGSADERGVIKLTDTAMDSAKVFSWSR